MTAINKSERLEKLRKLVDKFYGNLSQYTEKNYKETRLRMDFVDQFFELFDWDISNKEGVIEEFRDVIIEDNLEISGTQNYPDYTFRIGNEPVFFVETKKPSIFLKESIDPAYQVRRYGYTAKRKISILTDFQEFAIYDTRIKPGKNDKASVARLFYCTYEEYEKNWDFLYGLFSKDAIKKGSINNYVGSGTKKGYSEVDKDFLKLIEEWRSELAKNIAKNNKKTDLYGINMAVQKIIDRIIFLRICEEKGIEQFENLRHIGNDKRVYENLVLYFDKANKKYNSELFKPNEAINSLNIDDDVFEKIIKGLYYPECPYAFSVLPVEILGNIYEQFLGKTIRLTESHMAKIEEKPEVRKAGGVYYTPKYIVDYIVKNTVGEKVKGLTPKEIKELKIVDPACGSGSFLLGAYTYLLNYHLAYYAKKENLSKALKNEVIYLAKKDSYKLTIKEKQNILLNNIFGVDIDAQAVEVTKLSLMLKLLEGESDESAGNLFKFSDTKLLPTLSDNVKCGNSLIGSDFYKDKNLSLFGNDEMKKINIFDWQKEFPEIFKAGGFDCVIGNPPYVLSREHLSDIEKQYFSRTYKTLREKPNTFIMFMERAMSSLSRDGKFSFIVPNSWLTIESGQLLRKLILSDYNLEFLLDILYEVFDGAKVETTIFQVDRSKNSKGETKCKKVFFPFEIISKEYVEYSQRDWLAGSDTYKIHIPENISLDKVSSKLIHSSGMVGKFFDVKTGLQAYEQGKGVPKQSLEDVKNRIYDYDYKYDKNTYPYIEGKNCGRYYSSFDGKYLRYGNWLSQPRKLNIFSRKRILIREITGKPPRCILGCYSDKLLLNNKSILNILDFYDNDDNLKILLAQLNSRLFSVFYKNRAIKSSRRLFPKIVIKDLNGFPCMLNVNKSVENKLIQYVDQMLETQKKYHSAKSETDKRHYQQKIEILDKQIDELVYELYGLTEAEIRVVEGEK